MTDQITIFAYVKRSDINNLMVLLPFINNYQYSNDITTLPNEWGKMDFGTTSIRFLCRTPTQRNPEQEVTRSEMRVFNYLLDKEIKLRFAERRETLE